MSATGAQYIDAIRDAVADRIGAARFRTWFGENVEFDLTDEGCLLVKVANNFVGGWIAANFMDDLAAAAQEALGNDNHVTVRIIERAPEMIAPACDEPAQPPQAPPPLAPRRPQPKRAALRGSLDGFVVGDCNRMAYSAAMGLLDPGNKTFNLLVVHGGCGLGKTHLLQGICNALHRSRPTLEWRYVSGEEFTNEFISAVKGGRIDRFRERFRTVDVLVIDDIHFLANKTATQDEFLHTFNAIDACGNAVVLSSDKHPRQIATLSEPLINRLISGMVVQVQPPDFATRREILRRRAMLMDQLIGDDVIDLVADLITSNVRELEGALYKLVALASLTHKPITVELARTALDEHIIRQKPQPQVADIERAVAARFGVTPEQIRSRSRDRTVSLARGVTMYLVRQRTDMSYPEIGRALGKKNHSTVLMAVQRVERQLQTDTTVAWKTTDGRHEALLSNLIANLDAELFPNPR